MKVKKHSEQATKDKDLVAVIQDKNSTKREKDNAFTKLYATHSNGVKFYFLKRMKDKDTAQDLIMVTFEKVHRNIDSYNPDLGAFSTWIYKIARNALIDFSRKANFEVISLDLLSQKASENNEGMDFQIDGDVSTPEDEMIASEIKKEVYEALDSLKSKKTRELVICKYIKGMSFKEISEEFDIELKSTLRTRVRRGRKELIEKLAHLKTRNISKEPLAR